MSAAYMSQLRRASPAGLCHQSQLVQYSVHLMDRGVRQLLRSDEIGSRDNSWMTTRLSFGVCVSSSTLFLESRNFAGQVSEASPEDEQDELFPRLSNLVCCTRPGLGSMAPQASAAVPVQLGIVAQEPGRTEDGRRSLGELEKSLAKAKECTEDVVTCSSLDLGGKAAGGERPPGARWRGPKSECFRAMSFHRPPWQVRLLGDLAQQDLSGAAQRSQVLCLGNFTASSG